MDIWKYLASTLPGSQAKPSKAYARLSVKYLWGAPDSRNSAANDAYKAAVKYAKAVLQHRPSPGSHQHRSFLSLKMKNIPNQAQEKDEPDFEQLITGSEKAQEASRREIDAGLSCVKIFIWKQKQRLKTLNSFYSPIFAEFHQDPYFISQFIHILKRCPIDATVKPSDQSIHIHFLLLTANCPVSSIRLLDKRIKRDSRTRSFITFGIVLIALGAMMVYHFTIRPWRWKYSAANVEAIWKIYIRLI